MLQACIYFIAVSLLAFQATVLIKLEFEFEFECTVKVLTIYNPWVQQHCSITCQAETDVCTKPPDDLEWKAYTIL